MKVPSEPVVPGFSASGVHCGVKASGLDLALLVSDRPASVAGGFRISEPAADLGIVLALASSLQNTALDAGLVAFGEVGLSGELRRVPQAQRRLTEAARLGLDRCILPEACTDGLEVPGGMRVTKAKTLREAVRAALGAGGTAKASNKADRSSAKQRD